MLARFLWAGNYVLRRNVMSGAQQFFVIPIVHFVEMVTLNFFYPLLVGMRTVHQMPLNEHLHWPGLWVNRWSWKILISIRVNPLTG